MHTTTVTVDYVNQPKPGKKMGSIKAQDGVYYNVWPDKLSLFMKGGVYEIEYTEDNGFRTFKKLVKAVGNAAQHVGRAAQNVTGTFQRQPDAKAAEMFVMGFMNRCYQGASVVPPRSQLVAEMQILRSAWDEVWAPVTHTPPRQHQTIEPDDVDPLNDEIPF